MWCNEVIFLKMVITIFLYCMIQQIINLYTQFYFWSEAVLILEINLEKAVLWWSSLQAKGLVSDDDVYLTASISVHKLLL